MEGTMRSLLRHGAPLIVLACAVALGVAQDKWSNEATADTPSSLVAADDTTGSVGNALAPQRDTLALDNEQLGWIFLGIINQPDTPESELPLAMVSDALPESIALQDLPAMVTQKLPQMKDYKFVKLDDRILLVSPQSRLVVAQIPRYKLIIR
jgi:hypothetical protein